MHFLDASSIRSLIVGIVIASCVSAGHAETTGEAYQRLAQGISGLTYGDFLYQRSPRHCEDNPDLKTSLEHLEQAMAVKTSLAELTDLVNHPEPKVRSLAIMRLYNMEDPAAFRVIYSRASDQEPAFPNRSFLTEDENGRAVLSSEPMTVGRLADMMLAQPSFPLRWLSDPATEGAIEEWIGWYRYLYSRATGRTSPIPKDRVPKMVAVRGKIDALPPTTRAWMLLKIGTIDLDINEGRDPRVHIPLFAKEEELIAAAKQLGPDALLAFLRDGTCTGLRGPKSGDNGKTTGENWKCRKFILDHARQLFRKQDAEILKSMEEPTAAADADPEIAAVVIRDALAKWEWNGDKSVFYDRRGGALAALMDLCGDQESDFIIKTFYDEPWATARSNATDSFICELRRRKPKEWRKTLRGVVAHPGFECLDIWTLVGFARLTAELGNTSIPTNQDNRNLPPPQIRNLLRAYFDLPVPGSRTLEERIEVVKTPVMTAKLPINAEFFELSPDGSILAAVPWNGPVGLFSTLDGKAMGELVGEGPIRALHFERTNGHVRTLSQAGLLQTWDITTAKEISRTQLDISKSGYRAVFSKSGDFLVTPDEGFSAIDLIGGKPPWRLGIGTRGSGMSRLSPDGSRLAINNGFGKTIRLFDVAAAKPIATLEGHADVPGAEFSPDSTVFISCDPDNKVIIRDGKTGEFHREFTCPSGFIIWCLCAMNSGDFVCPTESGSIALFDGHTGIATKAFAHSSEIGDARRCQTTALRITEDGKKLIGLVGYSTGRRGRIDTYIECWDLDP